MAIVPGQLAGGNLSASSSPLKQPDGMAADREIFRRSGAVDLH